MSPLRFQPLAREFDGGLGVLVEEFGDVNAGSVKFE